MEERWRQLLEEIRNRKQVDALSRAISRSHFEVYTMQACLWIIQGHQILRGCTEPPIVPLTNIDIFVAYEKRGLKKTANTSAIGSYFRYPGLKGHSWLLPGDLTGMEHFPL